MKVVQVPVPIDQPQEIPQGYYYSVTNDYQGACFDQTTNTIIQ